MIILLTIMGIAFTGIVRMLVEHIRTTGLRTGDTRAYYLAQAGVMEAFYDYRDASDSLNAFDPGTAVIVDDDPSSGKDDGYILVAQARDGLLANMKPGQMGAPGVPAGCGGGSRDRFMSWRLRNVIGTAAPAVAIDQIAVDWSPSTGSQRVHRIELNGAKVWPSGGTQCTNGTRNAFLDLSPNFPLAPGGVVAGTNTVWFNGTGFASGALTTKTYIDLKFLMTDGTTRTARFANTVGSREAAFSVTSVGRAYRGPLPYLLCRRLRTTYKVCPGVFFAAGCDSAAEEVESAGKESSPIDLGSVCS